MLGNLIKIASAFCYYERSKQGTKQTVVMKTFLSEKYFNCKKSACKDAGI